MNNTIMHNPTAYAFLVAVALIGVAFIFAVLSYIRVGGKKDGRSN